MSIDEDQPGTTSDLFEGDAQFRQVFFGRLVRLPVEWSATLQLTLPAQVVEGSARFLIAKFDVKKRVYYGNTSMEAEMSLIMANQALVRTNLHRLTVG